MSIRQVGDLLCERYEVRAVLGTRPLGILYRAFDPQENREVSVRTFAAELLPNDVTREHFRAHLAPSLQLTHPAWVQLHDIAFDAGHAVLIADWVTGWQLSSQTAVGPLSLEQIAAMVPPVCDVLRYVHNHFGALGDVRAENILLSHGEVRVLSRGAGLALPRDRYLGALRGTAIYARLAPEILEFQPVDARADIYSLGLLIVELMTGVLPTLPLRQLPGAPSGLLDLLARSLNPDPAVRPQTIDEFLSELLRLLTATKSGPLTALMPTEGSVPTHIPVPAGKTRPVGVVEIGESPSQAKNVPDPLPQKETSDITRKLREQELDALLQKSSGGFDLSGVVPGTPTPMPLAGSVPEYVAPHTTSSVTRHITATSRPVRLPLPAQAGVRSIDWLRAFGIALLATGFLVAILLGWQLLRRHDQKSSVERKNWEADVQRSIADTENKIVQPTAGAGADTAHASAFCNPGQIFVKGTVKSFCIDKFEYSESGTLPRVDVTYQAAAAVCQERGGRLCLETEWEEACRGKGQSSFPYGSKYLKNVCNTQGSYRTLLATGSLGQCRSHLGVYDMSGNAAEWVTDAKKNQPLVMGGSALDADPLVRCSHRYTPADDHGSPWVGFRCCAEPKQPPSDSKKP